MIRYVGIIMSFFDSSAEIFPDECYNDFYSSIFVFKYDLDFNIFYSNSNCQKYLGLDIGDKITSEELSIICGSKDCFSSQKLNPIMFSKSRVNVDGSSLSLNWINFASAVENGEVREITNIGIDFSSWTLLKQKLDDAETKCRILFENVDIPIILTDMEGRFIEVNNEVCRMLGHGKEDLLKMSYKDVMAEEHARIIEKKIEGISEKPYFEFTLDLINKDDRNIFVHCRSKSIFIEGRDVILTVARDMTEKRKNEEDERRRRLKYDIRDGNVYLANCLDRETAIDAFKSLVACSYSGIVISSQYEAELRENINSDFKFYWISSQKRPGSIKPDYSSIDQRIGEIPRKSVVLIDDIEYLEANASYMNTLLFVKSLKELALIKCSVFILCVDLDLIDVKSRYVLEKETSKITKISEERINYNMERILKFVNDKNSVGSKPTHTDICKALKITRPTIKRNISNLMNRRYLVAHVDGRSKRLEITEKGKKEFENRIC
jgi:PAS domain S-box-containing protein